MTNPTTDPTLEVPNQIIEPNSLDKQSKLRVVGVGASAGGLEALQLMVANLPMDSDMCFIVAQHLSPSYKSMMVDLLEKGATLEVVAAKNHEPLKANCIYICPPNYNIEIDSADRIILTNFGESRHSPRPSVDMLFESIAIAKGEDAIGIILSGTGSDGSRGVRAIKGEGGFAIAQSPASAKYDGMPNSAINSGNIDLIVAPEEIGVELQNLIKFPKRKPSEVESTIPREVYNAVLRRLKRAYKVDFTLYKETTIVRRIERRMIVLKITKVEDYLSYLGQNEAEITFLFNDMLIGVTSFFRDAKAFEALHSELKQYLEHKDSKTVRVWVAGCSTGEEAYTIAMIIHEILGTKVEEYKVQIFASDIDKRAIEFARLGRYSESALQDLPKTFKQKYFTISQEQYEIIKPVKANVIFSEHDLISSPPFLRLDLISCRNVMIYFNLELQRQILPIFHYALNPSGLLFLGQSESIGVFQEQFRALSKSAKIYAAAFTGKKIPPDRNLSSRTIEDYIEVVKKIPTKPELSKHNTRLTELITERLNSIFINNAVLVNESAEIVFSQGINPLLVRPEGVPTNNIFKNLHPSLSVDLRAALHQLQNGQALVSTSFQKVKLHNENVWAKLILTEISHQAGIGKLTLIYCQVERELDMPLIMSDNSEVNSVLAQEQERQLMKTKEQLQTVIEELETSNEEMQSMNEELQSSNEELQSSNEELETTNEELQSTNEELQTAYAELRLAYEDKEAQQKELSKLQEELELANQLLEEAEQLGKTGSWRWDLKEHSLTWSQGSYRLFGVSDERFTPSYEAFIGLVYPEDRQALENHLSLLLTNQTHNSFKFRAYDANKQIMWVALEALVSFSHLKQAETVIGTFKNITQKIQTQNELDAKTIKIEYLMQHSLNGIYIFDFNTTQNVYVNNNYTKITGYTMEQLNNLTDEAFLALFHPDDLDAVLEHMNQVKNGRLGEAFALKYRFKHRLTQEYVTLYSNDTVFETNPITHQPNSMLGTFFEVEE
ncbi:CheR family methyltransferase [Thiosulfativibrio zosterae]|uniref:Protein-glutamate O-methyltransferase n=1 Tax=Thiosulfativibrio zosterae TaxID=2675053 RepID=A0A6F8PK93_9GAMM|nr:CheR family methyltransferase [Thiosulfativibrio zosterae]BBP42519.1 hypothetical protein THMIRHAT_02650 [Thiosulfativibrio zosterae]